MFRSLEDFSYFTLRKQATHGQPATSLFGIACSQQLEAAALKNRPPEVTRSTVQKAVVIIVSEPRHFGLLRERLSVVTGAWFAQRYAFHGRVVTTDVNRMAVTSQIRKY